MTAAAKTRLTPQQRAALEARDRSVALAAGAGCGKTFVLTERFIAELDPASAGDAAELDQLVAITFTDAAAREMRDRIRRACYDRLRAAATDAEAAAWQRLMRSMDAARISTIHAFCAALLRQHAVEAGLDPQFQVLDAPAAELLRLETIDDRLRTLLVDRNDDVLNYAAARGLDRLREDLAALAGAREAALVERWKDATPQQLVAAWLEFFTEQTAPRAAEQLVGSPEFRELVRLADPALAASDRLRAHLAELGTRLATAPAASVEALDHLRSLAMVKGVCTVKDWHDPADYERYGAACTALRALIDASPLKKPPDTDASHEAAALGLALVRLAADVGAAIDEAKRRRGQLEFDDLLVRTERLLADPAHAAVRDQAMRRTRLMMVDEFQDTNRQQVAIIQAFCGERWRQRGLFAVGDFKQSIYRFTGAVPDVSNDLRDDLPPAGRLSLTRNFRSQPAVLDFVNAVFCDAFANYEPLEPQREQLTPTPAVEFLWSPGARAAADDDAGDAEPPPGSSPRGRKGAKRDARAEEARWIARRIQQLVASGDAIVVDAKSARPTPRPLRLGDVAILLRSLSDAQVYEEALREAGLDYYLAGGHAFYSQQEIYDVLNLLRAVASTVDEIALAGALRSPLFALADETLFWLVDRHGSLHAALQAGDPPPQLAHDEAARVRRAAATLDRLRVEKDRLLVAELLALAVDLTGYDATLLAEFLGPRKAANLEKLFEQARAVDRNAPGDLAAFITQLSEFVLQAPKEALAATQAEGGDVVRIMTIHHAKGLEFPLVVVADLERQRHLGGAAPVLDTELGPLVPLAERDGTIGYNLHRWRENVEDLEERKRLLYVALTRAADYLILSSSIDDVDSPRCDWLQLVDARIGLADGALRSPLPVGYGVPQVRVITARPDAAPPAAGQGRGADLRTLVDETRRQAARGAGALPRAALPIAADAAARRRFSFSQITGLITPVDVARPAAAAAFDGDGDGEDAGDGDAAEADADGREAADATPTADAGGSGGREFGSLVHAILERVDFRRPDGVRRLADFLAPQLVGPAPERAAAEAAQLVERFLQTPLAAELAEAPVVRRELEYLLPWPPATRQSGALPRGGKAGSGGNAPARAASELGVYLHGYIDCLSQDAAGRWRLIDYKTNRVAPADVPRLAERYELQMLAYRLACEQALGEPVAECVLVLLHPGLLLPISWDAAAERRGIERIDAAISTLARR
jgi:ATP-dependent helicase/nuclease subunit A